jgi:hypothetical protein
MSRTECLARRNDAGHLFVCHHCRADARMAAAWSGARVAEPLVAGDEKNEKFVARVVARIQRDGVRQSRRRFWLAAAAAALFCFCAGLAHESADKPVSAAEESYATLASPNVLDGLLPN